MPWAVGAVAGLAYLAGFATGHGRWVQAGFFIAIAVGFALWLRHYVETSIEQAYEKGVGYGHSTRRRIRDLPEAHEVPAACKAIWLPDQESAPLL